MKFAVADSGAICSESALLANHRDETGNEAYP